MFGGAAVAVAVMVLVTPGGLMNAISQTKPPARNPATIDRTFHLDVLSIDDPSSNWVVADKLRPLQPTSWVPNDLVDVDVDRGFDMQMRAVAASMLKAMFDAYHEETGRGLKALSGYRSYEMQTRAFKNDFNLTAKPGHSEHQTGMAMDIGATSGKCPVFDCFADEPEAKWLEENSWKWGYILRYPKGYTEITGYQYEPWHFRYVGAPLAGYMHDNNIKTLEEVFSLPAAPLYWEQMTPEQQAAVTDALHPSSSPTASPSETPAG